jgi:hypothetical protein
VVERFGKLSGPDVLISVGNGADRFVCVLAESILRQLGPPWESLLSTQAKKTRRFRHRSHDLARGRIKTVNLRGEHPNAIRLILLIATHQYQKLPKILDFSEIVRLAGIAGRYGVQSLLVGYVDGWLRPYWNKLLSPGYEEWLLIAHQFGYEDEHRKLARFLAINCEIDESGKQLLAPRSGAFAERMFPLEIHGTFAANVWSRLTSTDQICETRKRILTNLVKATYDLWTDMSIGIHCTVSSESHSVRRRCAASNMLAFTQYLRGLDFFPLLRKNVTYRGSSVYLAKQLSDTKDAIRVADTIHMSRQGSATVKPSVHLKCHIGFRLRPIISEILEGDDWPMEDPTMEIIHEYGGKSQLHVNAGEVTICADESVCSRLIFWSRQDQFRNAAIRRLGR